MKAIYKDIILGLTFILGVYGFISGEFIISAVLFASSAIFSNINYRSNEGS